MIDFPRKLCEKQTTMREEDLFRLWLAIVGLTRAFAIINGYFNLALIRKNVYARAQQQVTDLFGRMFSNWTFLSVSLVFCLALYPTNKQVYALNLISFGVAFVHMFLEMTVYRTMGTLSAILMAFFSGFTSLYMISRVFLIDGCFDQK